MSKLYDFYISDMDSFTPVYWSGPTVNWLAQSFTPVDGYDIAEVILKLYREGPLPGNITLSIKATDIGTGKPIGPDLCFVTIDANAITTDVGGEEVTFTFGSPASLDTGTKYAIVLKAPITQESYVRWALDSSSASYAGGNYLISGDGGGSWSLDTGADFYFKTFGDGRLVDYYKILDDTGWTSIYGALDFGAQTFTASEDYIIEAVGLKLYRTGVTPGTFSIAITATDVITGHPTGPDLASGTINGNDLTISTVGEWKICTFSTPRALDSGTKYAIVVKCLSGSSGNNVAIRWDISFPTYTVGNSEWTPDGGANWNADDTRDLVFETYKSGNVAPEITDQSTDTTVNSGDQVNLFVTATGNPAPTYQWYKNDVIMSGKTNSTLTVYPTVTSTYKCIVTNVEGSDESNPIIVTTVRNPYVYNLFSLPLDIIRTD